MQKDEAKRTPITEFTNNVVHSNRVVSISIHCTVGQMLQRIIHRRLTIKKALIDYNVEEKNLIQKNGNRETIFFLFVMIIGYKRNLHWFLSSFHLNHKYFKIRLKVYFIWSELLIFIYHAREWYNLRMSTGFMMSSWNVMYLYSGRDILWPALDERHWIRFWNQIHPAQWPPGRDLCPTDRCIQQAYR